jgi:hypothetical protein
VTEYLSELSGSTDQQAWPCGRPPEHQCCQHTHMTLCNPGRLTHLADCVSAIARQALSSGGNSGGYGSRKSAERPTSPAGPSGFWRIPVFIAPAVLAAAAPRDSRPVGPGVQGSSYGLVPYAALPLGATHRSLPVYGQRPVIHAQ